MAELSVIEFVIYGMIGYATFLFIFLKLPQLDSIRIAFVIPGIICLLILALFGIQPEQSGIDAGGSIIFLSDFEVDTEHRDINNTRTGADIETLDQFRPYALDIQNRAFGLFHLLLAVLTSVYAIYSGITLLARRDNAAQK